MRAFLLHLIIVHLKLLLQLHKAPLVRQVYEHLRIFLRAKLRHYQNLVHHYDLLLVVNEHLQAL